MPNWIEGSLKVRGSYENVKRFFIEGLNSYEYDWETCTQKLMGKETWMDVSVYDEGEENEETDIEIKDKEWIYVENTARAFVIGGCCIYLHKDDCEVIGCAPIRQAWSFYTEGWKTVSKEYNVDIRLYGIECGMEFCQEVIIKGGELLADRKTKYLNWMWDCPFPLMGG